MRCLLAATLGTLLAVVFVAGPASAGRSRKHFKETPKTTGLGKDCKRSSDCKSKAQRCLRESDANGKEKQVGFCVLPCLAIDAGTTKVIPGQPIEATPEAMKEARKPPPPRCPPHFQCRSAGTGVPIDLCIKE
jgi:hypothetical protein